VTEERPKFRFMDLEIWKDAIGIAENLFDLANRLEEKRLYRFAEQLRGSGLSMSNNIAEGSGSNSKREFANFLNIARRSTFENANVLLVLEKCRVLGERDVTEMLQNHKLPEKSSRLRLCDLNSALCICLVFLNAMHHALCSLQ